MGLTMVGLQAAQGPVLAPAPVLVPAQGLLALFILFPHRLKMTFGINNWTTTATSSGWDRRAPFMVRALPRVAANKLCGMQFGTLRVKNSEPIGP